MPTYKNPFEKGRLFISFHVDFPANNFATPEALLALEKLLPPRPAQAAIPIDAEETVLQEYDPEAHEFGKVSLSLLFLRRAYQCHRATRSLGQRTTRTSEVDTATWADPQVSSVHPNNDLLHLVCLCRGVLQMRVARVLLC